MEIQHLKNVTVSSEVISEVLNLNKKYISQLVREKKFPKASHNSYPLIEFIQRFIEYKNELNENEKRKIRELVSNRDRLEKAQADLKEIELEEKQKKLIPSDEVESVMLTAAQVYVKGLEAFETTLPPILVNAKDQSEITAIIRDAVFSNRTQIADIFERAAVMTNTNTDQKS